VNKSVPILPATAILAAIAIFVLLVAPQGARAQAGYDFSSGYAYLPDGYNKLSSDRVGISATRVPRGGTTAGISPVSGPEPVPTEGDFFPPSGQNASWQFIGDYLYIRPSNAEVAYAQVVDAGSGLPIGRTGVANPYHDIGFRVSGARALGDGASLGVSYAYFDTTVATSTLASDNPQLLVPPDSQVRSLVFHPAAPNAGILGDTAIARQTVRFQMGDVDYKAAMVSGPRYCANLLVGARFLDLDQRFESSITDGSGFSELMYADVRFEGGGVRFGVEGERQSPSSGFLVYGKGTMSFVAGTVRARFSEFNELSPFVVDGFGRFNRLLSMLDFELGAGWTNVDGTIRVTGGWMMSGWYNTVKPSNLIRAVQTTTPGILDSPPENVLAFDGLVFRVELRF